MFAVVLLCLSTPGPVPAIRPNILVGINLRVPEILNRIKDSVDETALRTLTPLQVPPPTFQLLKRAVRVVCFVLEKEEAVLSGATVNTIAFGDLADEELKTMAEETVISQAAHEDVYLVTVTDRMDQQTRDGQTPMVKMAISFQPIQMADDGIYSRCSRGTPKKVTAQVVKDGSDLSFRTNLSAWGRNKKKGSRSSTFP
ncbi:hypothetical protein Baya_13985 [Bagarius yarrelli]|uniref:Uncharacterized protein n=1 Tax=Bagarius yarrelli TaxID=175774 RepID=A0A556V769_BAGYA|nr:hypothetical protein Baya_13985 [Bagarius yarrelli]